jgi:hypothetical protein
MKKNIQKKPTNPNFFTIWTGTTGIFLSLIIDEAEPRPIAILNEDLHTLVQLNKLYVLM